MKTDSWVSFPHRAHQHRPAADQDVRRAAGLARMRARQMPAAALWCGPLRWTHFSRS